MSRRPAGSWAPGHGLFLRGVWRRTAPLSLGGAGAVHPVFLSPARVGSVSPPRTEPPNSSICEKFAGEATTFESFVSARFEPFFSPRFWHFLPHLLFNSCWQERSGFALSNREVHFFFIEVPWLLIRNWEETRKLTWKITQEFSYFAYFDRSAKILPVLIKISWWFVEFLFFFWKVGK